MLEHASGQFTIDGQVEDIFGGTGGAARLAHISQTCVFTGAFAGEGIAEYSVVLPRESAGSFQGFQRLTGTLGERGGSFVVRVTGEYAKGQTRGDWEIVPKTGSGDFVHIRGSGRFSQFAGKPGSYSLEFDLRKPRRSRTGEAVAETKPAVAHPKRTSTVETPTIAAEPVVPAPSEPKRTPSRKKSAMAVDQIAQISQIVEVAAVPATRKRVRKTAQPAAQLPAVADIAQPAEPKPIRRKKAAPTTPIEAPATPPKSARQRKEIAA